VLQQKKLLVLEKEMQQQKKVLKVERGKVEMLSLSINNKILLVSAENYVEIDRLANKVMKIIGYSKR